MIRLRMVLHQTKCCRSLKSRNSNAFKWLQQSGSCLDNWFIDRSNLDNLSTVVLVHKNKWVSENLFFDSCSNDAVWKNGGIEPWNWFESIITWQPSENIIGKIGIVPVRLLYEIFVNLEFSLLFESKTTLELHLIFQHQKYPTLQDVFDSSAILEN